MTITPKQVEPTTIEAETLEIVRGLLTELGSDRIARTASLHSSFERDLGLGSLERVELLVRCESRFSVRLPDEIAQRAETPAEWVRAILERAQAGPPHSRSTRPRYRIEPPSRQAPPAPDSARTWVEVLRRHAEVEPDRVHIHLLEDRSGQDVTYGELLETASEVAAGLIAAGLQRDETVAIMLPTCSDFFYAFFGVMLAGGIAVPIYPPARPDKIEEYVRRQVSILRNAEVRFLISFDRVRAISRIMRLSIPSLVDVKTVAALRQAGAGLAGGKSSLPGVEPSDLGFIQYTSGSTGDPKGVGLTHANILENVRGIGWAVRARPTDIVVSWLPLYHDMGLIGSWLFSVYFGVPITILSPLSFLSRPERWLWALHDSRATLCPAPNFAYELCARKIPDHAIEGLDLRAWRVAINAGEAVLPETLARFAERFAPYGFRPESFVPCYGLAESSVALTFSPIDRRPVIDVIRRDAFEAEGRAVPAGSLSGSEVLRFVASGRPLPDHEVRIEDDQGRELGERVQGRLFFRGPSRTPGYYRNPEATAVAVTQDGWMDSGDLAYWADHELFITGRSKDCIIKSGRNIIPQEVEAAAAEVPGVRRGCVAAFGTVDQNTGTERLVVVAETRVTAAKELQRIKAEIAKSVDAVLGIPPNKIVLVPPQSIPKTSSGKIRRNETRSLYERRELKAAKKAPWVQILSLGLGNCGLWLGSGLKWVGAGLRRAHTRALLLTVARCTGLLVRLMPSRKVAAKLVGWAARWLLRLSGQPVTVQGGEQIVRHQPAVLVANRAGRLDPLVLAASIPPPFLIADKATLAALPREAAFLLKPLLLAPLNGEVTPPGGTLRQRIRRGLEEGHSVLVLPDSPAGVPAHLCRFRLDAIHAAVATSRPIVPIGVRGTSRILQPARNLNGEASIREGQATVHIGKRIHSEMTDQRELVGLRERIRDAIAHLVAK
jgi:acyl carrier protein